MGESMVGLKRTHYCTQVKENFIGEEVVVMGWVQKRRNLGSLIFIDLRDRSGILQVVFDENDINEEGFRKAETLRSEFVIGVRGKVRKRESINPNIETGYVEIIATELLILSEAETPPFAIEENSSVKEDLRLRYRYLDLRRPDLQKNLMLRHRVAQSVRTFLDNEGFLEIETPMLARSTPEGARDYLVPSRIHQGDFYALPQSPQTFKQLLMVSGFDRYFQIVKCFRDEDLRADRQPEFTQIDMELSFVQVEDVIDINERLLKKVFKDAIGIDIPLPIPRLTYQKAMDRFGSDKPDIRFGIELTDISEVVKDSGFKVFEGAIQNGGSVRGINAKGCGNFPRKQVDSLVEVGKTYGAKGIAWISLGEDGNLKSSFTKFLSEDTTKAILEIMDAENGDLLLFCADKNSVVYDALGNLRLEVAKRLELTEKGDFNFVWITEFPLLEWDEEEKRFVAKHHPFTMPMDEDIKLLDTDPGKVRAKAYDICLNGVELGGGSIRINQTDIQEKMFSVLGFTKEAAYKNFGFLLNAFKYGVPPHGGLAYGLDRMVMLMAEEDSIRDVIAFPKVKDASCPMTEAPGKVSEKQLDELGLKVDLK
ncbi:MAG: aspartate--tRNA ligase [Epulopiscium sp.]|nr:aspartate--tRNA ligase [Candidatus Epulonipiscium sp.]